MSEDKIQLLAKWFSNHYKYWREDDPDLEILDKMTKISAKAYEDGGRFTEGMIAANATIIRFVIEMEDQKPANGGK